MNPTDLIREAAAMIEDMEGSTVFPGWDFANPNEVNAMHDIRDAAFAILNNTDPDNGIAVSYKDLGQLLNYIADMLE
jgi:hypothetical protein